VCIYRIPLKQSIAVSRSKCTACNNILKPWDLIPVLSYIFLKGKCRYCGEKISIKYPIVELVTAIQFIVIYQIYGISFEFVAIAFLTSLMNVVFVIDLVHLIIPNKIVLVGIIGGVLVQIYHFIYGYKVYFSEFKYNGILAVGIITFIMILIFVIGYLIYKGDGALGMGDVKIFIPIALFLGWELTLLAFWFAIVIIGIFSLLLLVLKKVNRKSTIPFGPFIAIGVFISSILGQAIINIFIKKY